MTRITLHEIAALVDGTLVGDGDVELVDAATIRTAKPGTITLADNEKHVGQLPDCEAAAVVVGAGVTPPNGMPSVVVEDVHAAFAKIVSHFHPPRPQKRIGISPAAHVSDSARIAADVDIHPHAMIGDEVEIGAGTTIHAGACVMAGSKLGKNVEIFPNAVLYENTIVGSRTTIHAGAVIGAHGFGYETVDGRHQLSAQLGWVEIGDDVEIGANSCVDRGTYGPTRIDEGTKLDNFVQIGHNCRIGRHNLLCAHVGTAGSSSTGEYVVLGGQVGVRDHTHVGDRSMLGAQAGVVNNIPSDSSYVGSPAVPARDKLKQVTAQARLPEMRKQLKALQAQVDALLAGDAKQEAA